MKAPNTWSGVLSLDGLTQLLVEPFRHGDLDVIYGIERRAHPFPWGRSHFEDSLKASHHHCLGVRSGETWLAYAIVSCVAGEAELLLLVVDNPWQGRGLAKQLLLHVVQCLHGQADNLFLEVRASNERAIGLYETLDFNQVGTRPGYYRSAGKIEDALIYARTLG